MITGKRWAWPHNAMLSLLDGMVGFTGSDSWKRSSPVVEWDFKEYGLDVSTESGSKYVLHKDIIGVTMLTQSLISDAGLTVVSEWEDVCKLVKGVGNV